MSVTPLEARRAPSVAATVELLRSSGKPSATAPLYSRLVNRPVGRWLAAVAHRLGRTPDQVTALSGLVTATGIALLALVPPSTGLGVGVAALLVLGYALDSADGQLARLRGGGTLTGEWLDHVLDCAKNAAVHLAVLISFYRFVDPAPPALLLLPAAFQLVVTVMFFGTVLTDQLRRGAGTGRAPAPATPPSPLRSVLVAPADYGLLCLAFATFGHRAVFVPVYAVLLAGSAGYLAAGLVRWRRQLAALDAAR
ncbi:CDP-alcohol phosphatidyltransferase family protein [Blastococcus sp. SYSU D00695]